MIYQFLSIFFFNLVHDWDIIVLYLNDGQPFFGYISLDNPFPGKDWADDVHLWVQQENNTIIQMQQMLQLYLLTI